VRAWQGSDQGVELAVLLAGLAIIGLAYFFHLTLEPLKALIRGIQSSRAGSLAVTAVTDATVDGGEGKASLTRGIQSSRAGPAVTADVTTDRGPGKTSSSLPPTGAVKGEGEAIPAAPAGGGPLKEEAVAARVLDEHFDIPSCAALTERAVCGRRALKYVELVARGANVMDVVRLDKQGERRGLMILEVSGPVLSSSSSSA
jgi:hypothetical protein